MLHTLNVYTFFYSLFVNNFNFFVCPQLVVKTKYTDTLIKLLLILRGLSGCIRRLIARKGPKRIKYIYIYIYNNNDNNNMVPKLFQ